MSEREDAPVECPFSGHDSELVNVKFFRGTRDDVITGDEIRAQEKSALNQLRMKTATSSKMAPVSTHPVVNVREFVNSL